MLLDFNYGLLNGYAWFAMKRVDVSSFRVRIENEAVFVKDLLII